jgi:hypothetical protein
MIPAGNLGIRQAKFRNRFISEEREQKSQERVVPEAAKVGRDHVH